MLFLCYHQFLHAIIAISYHENFLTIIKFYDLSKLLKEKKFTDFKFYGSTTNCKTVKFKIFIAYGIINMYVAMHALL